MALAHGDVPRTGVGASLVVALNSRWHERAMGMFALVVAAHWLEHVAQAAQVYVLGMPPAQALGALGMAWPWLAASEWLHYGYAVVMLAALWLLRPGMAGRARTWWNVALWIQVWHHLEHALLLVQAQSGILFFGATGPTSIAQLVVPRVELHLLYNTMVTVPMVIAMLFHLWPDAESRGGMRCSCARSARGGKKAHAE